MVSARGDVVYHSRMAQNSGQINLMSICYPKQTISLNEICTNTRPLTDMFRNIIGYISDIMFINKKVDIEYDVIWPGLPNALQLTEYEYES